MSTHEIAAEETAGVEIHGITRGAFILRGALATATASGLGSVGPFVASALAKGGDIEILNFALTLEYLEANFYSVGRRLDLASEVNQLAKQFGDHEQEHVDALTATIKDLGGKPARRPTFSFPIPDEKSFLKLAQTLEDTGVSAYNGAAPQIESRDVLAAAAGIVQVEARHAAAIRLARDQDPAPRAFDPTLAKDDVLKAVKPFITRP